MDIYCQKITLKILISYSIRDTISIEIRPKYFSLSSKNLTNPQIVFLEFCLSPSRYWDIQKMNLLRKNLCDEFLYCSCSCTLRRINMSLSHKKYRLLIYPTFISSKYFLHLMSHGTTQGREPIQVSNFSWLIHSIDRMIVCCMRDDNCPIQSYLLWNRYSSKSTKESLSMLLLLQNRMKIESSVHIE